MHRRSLRSRAMLHPSLKVEYLYKSFGILLHGRFVYSVICIKDSFILSLGLQFNINLPCCLQYPVLTTGSSFSWLLCSFDICHHGGYFFLFLALSKFSGIIRCSRHELYISCLSSRIDCFSKECWFFLLKKWLLETKM